MDEIKRTADGKVESRASVEHDIRPNQGAAQTPSPNEGKTAPASSQGSDEA